MIGPRHIDLAKRLRDVIRQENVTTPCREQANAITRLEEAIFWLERVPQPVAQQVPTERP